MKKKWIIPEFKVLGLEFTTNEGPTAFYLSTALPGVDFNYQWTCSCCGTSNGGFGSQEQANQDYIDKHIYSCPKWNYSLDKCGVS